MSFLFKKKESSSNDLTKEQHSQARQQQQQQQQRSVSPPLTSTPMSTSPISSSPVTSPIPIPMPIQQQPHHLTPSHINSHYGIHAYSGNQQSGGVPGRATSPGLSIPTSSSMTTASTSMGSGSSPSTPTSGNQSPSHTNMLNHNNNITNTLPNNPSNNLNANLSTNTSSFSLSSPSSPSSSDQRGSASPTASLPSTPPNEAQQSFFSVIEDKPSEEAIILRQHFASLTDLHRQTFNIGDTLGTGTFGRVRLVSYHYPLLSSKPLHFALKMLKKSEILRLKQVEHIKAEKSILSRICHPFIVNLYAHFQDEKCLYMLMEYVIGGELFSQLRKVGRFSNDTARFYAAEIVLALQYLHSKDIVYRDLKPENLLIDREGHIKITDFGFAKVVEDRTWTVCGTPEYLAPEIIQSKGHGKAVDWWALGILVYEMIAGYPPFYDENPFGIYQKILAGRIEFPKHFDPYAKDLVKKLLTGDRTKRFGCLKDGADDIKRHRWFKGVDWGRVHQRRVKPPYIPGFTSADDTSNFDKYPDSDTEDTTPLTHKDREQFQDF